MILYYHLKQIKACPRGYISYLLYLKKSCFKYLKYDTGRKSLTEIEIQITTLSLVWEFNIVQISRLTGEKKTSKMSKLNRGVGRKNPEGGKFGARSAPRSFYPPLRGG